MTTLTIYIAGSTNTFKFDSRSFGSADRDQVGLTLPPGGRTEIAITRSLQLDGFLEGKTSSAKLSAEKIGTLLSCPAR